MSVSVTDSPVERRNLGGPPLRPQSRIENLAIEERLFADEIERKLLEISDATTRDIAAAMKVVEDRIDRRFSALKAWARQRSAELVALARVA